MTRKSSRTVRYTTYVLTTTAVLMACAACGSSGTAAGARSSTLPVPLSVPSTSSALPDSDSPTSPSDTTAASQPPSVGATSNGSFTFTSSTGVTVRGILNLQTPVAASDAQSAWTSVGGTGDIPCVTDAQTDAVMIGFLEFQNQTSSYTPDFYLNFQSIATGGGLALGAGYSDGNQCITDGSDAWEGSAIQPTWAGAVWGPLPIDIVIHNDIGPSYPNGNPANLGTVNLVINSTGSDSFTIASTDGTISRVNGQDLSLNLAGSN